MSSTDWLILLGVLVGGAVPWLEAIVVIPAGILAGAPVVPVVVAGVAGNLLTVALSAWFGERLRAWWVARRGRRGAGAATVDRVDVPAPGRQSRAARLMARWGLPALAVFGPIGLGTQLSALVAVGAGARAGITFIWIGGGTVVWSVAAAIAALTGMSVAGIGE